MRVPEPGLNAPFGARCFLTLLTRSWLRWVSPSLNAPFGARCVLTCRIPVRLHPDPLDVLMHRLALGAF